jgi:hypothetical protein
MTVRNRWLAITDHQLMKKGNVHCVDFEDKEVYAARCKLNYSAAECAGLVLAPVRGSPPGSSIAEGGSGSLDCIGLCGFVILKRQAHCPATFLAA